MQAFREHSDVKRARLVSRTLDSRLMERERYHYATRAGSESVIWARWQVFSS